jgi:hypothetical protein
LTFEAGQNLEVDEGLSTGIAIEKKKAEFLRLKGVRWFGQYLIWAKTSSPQEPGFPKAAAERWGSLFFSQRKTLSKGNVTESQLVMPPFKLLDFARIFIQPRG